MGHPSDDAAGREERRDLEELERNINAILARRQMALMTDPALTARFAGLFDQSGEVRRGEGETPTWAPNEAYMQSFEWLWEPVEPYMKGMGLALEKSVRDLFPESREYRDRAAEHRRVFFGQILDVDEGSAVSAFMLTVPHSHRGFEYPAAVVIQISSAMRAGPRRSG